MCRLLLLACVVLTTTGCASIQDYRYRKANEWRAYRAWQTAKAEMPRECVDSDYGDGFQDGYMNVALGGCGNLPPVPPHQYWEAKYQCCEGRAQIERYFAGWQCGAVAAEKCGRQYWHRIPSKVCNDPCVPECENCLLNDQSITKGSDSAAMPQEETQHSALGTGVN